MGLCVSKINSTGKYSYNSSESQDDISLKELVARVFCHGADNSYDRDRMNANELSENSDERIEVTEAIIELQSEIDDEDSDSVAVTQEDYEEIKASFSDEDWSKIESYFTEVWHPNEDADPIDSGVKRFPFFKKDIPSYKKRLAYAMYKVRDTEDSKVVFSDGKGWNVNWERYSIDDCTLSYTIDKSSIETHLLTRLENSEYELNTEEQRISMRLERGSDSMDQYLALVTTAIDNENNLARSAQGTQNG
ncbi:MAG: hypothetical protein GY874_06230 [Desulfobacteraceae bacterium]|nr:hypothetical protein [Desulfobacteraceae bacterium]